LILKGAILVVLDLQVLKWLPQKRKAGLFGSAQGKQTQALQTEFSTRSSISDYKGKSTGKRLPVSISGSSMCDRSFDPPGELGTMDGSENPAPPGTAALGMARFARPRRGEGSGGVSFTNR
jgi:hypothetical protein